MSSSHEIVTIQAGNFSNFVGTHWWNIQESSFCYTQDAPFPSDIDHDVLFREGLNQLKETTYTPRLVLIDFKDNLRSIRRECALYRYSNEEKSETLWDGPVDVIKENPVRKNPFLEEFEKLNSVPSDSNVSQTESSDLPEMLFDFNSPETQWSDFLRTNLHPKSFCLLNSISSENKNPLDIYSAGYEFYIKNGKDEIEDSIRRISEECDYLQGFHLLFDAHNGFAGISTHILQYLDDEYHRRPSLCFPTFQDCKLPVRDLNEQMHRLYAVLLSLSNMNSYSSLFSPLCLSNDVITLSEPNKKFPFLHYDEKLRYHTSAIYAAVIETLTSQFRLKHMKFSLSDVTSAMSMYGRKVVSSSICLPFPLSNDAYLSTMVEKDIPEYFMTSLSPFYTPQTERTLYQSAVLRGVPKVKFQRPSKSLFHTTEPEELFGQYLNKYSSSSITTATVFEEMCSVASPFPKIFNSLVGMNGFLNADAFHNHQGVVKVPVAASFSSADSASQFIDDLLMKAQKLLFKEYVKSAESAFEKDDYVEVLENLIGLQENYQNY